jgi:hypothetical protein
MTVKKRTCASQRQQTGNNTKAIRFISKEGYEKENWLGKDNKWASQCNFFLCEDGATISYRSKCTNINFGTI